MTKINGEYYFPLTDEEIEELAEKKTKEFSSMFSHPEELKAFVEKLGKELDKA